MRIVKTMKGDSSVIQTLVKKLVSGLLSADGKVFSSSDLIVCGAVPELRRQLSSSKPAAVE